MNNIDAARLCEVSNILYNKTILELSKQINELKKENKKLIDINEQLLYSQEELIKNQIQLDATHIFDDISGNLIPYNNTSIIGSYPEPTRSFRNNKI